MTNSTTLSLSINHSLSPPFPTPPTLTTTPSFFSISPHNSLRFAYIQSFRPKPIAPFCRKTRFCSLQGSSSAKSRKSLALGTTHMTIAEDSLLEVVEEDEESPPDFSLLDPESNSRPRRIALFVEPSPFA